MSRNKDEQVTDPLNVDEQNPPVPYEYPPPYEHPKIDLNSGWKDRAFAIAFWIHGVIVIGLAGILGVPSLLNKTEERRQNIEIKTINGTEINTVHIVLGFTGSIGTAFIASIVTFLLMKVCSRHFIRNSFILIITLEILLIVLACFIHVSLCITPGIFLLITLIYVCCVRRRIQFSEAHLQAGCSALNAHRSLLLVALLMMVIQFIWVCIWLLMATGVVNFFFGSSTKETSSSMDGENSVQNQHVNEWGKKVLAFFLFLSYYWGSITFGNIAHFVSACAVGQWWFTDEASEQYGMGTSIRRAFTTNFGTICFGSLFEAIIKSLRRSADSEKNKSILACVLSCILSCIEKIIGYLNEWAFIISALTGQSFIEASKTFIELFKKRGWTMVINDSIITTTLGFINLLIGLLAGSAGSFVVYSLSGKPMDALLAIILVGIIGLFIGIFISAVITTILISCVRTVFVCFAFNPAALGATHPKHLERLSHVWHKYYPKEFAESGYAQHLPEKAEKIDV